jgi:hypothetical protein
MVLCGSDFEPTHSELVGGLWKKTLHFWVGKVFLEFSDSAMEGLWDNFRLCRLSSTVREWRK